ncbi:hypothetical protein [Borreliella garinii]|nr:hypothetical protein [Borreliella garinii]
MGYNVLCATKTNLIGSGLKMINSLDELPKILVADNNNNDQAIITILN